MGWTPRQLRYQAWLAIPTTHRPNDLTTKKEVAKWLGVRPDTLEAWQYLPGWWDGVFVNSQTIIGKALGNITTALVTRAEAGNVSAIKLAFEALGVSIEKVEHNVHVESDQLIVMLASDDKVPAKPKVDEEVES